MSVSTYHAPMELIPCRCNGYKHCAPNGALIRKPSSPDQLDRFCFKILKYLSRGISAWPSRDATARMSAGAA